MKKLTTIIATALATSVAVADETKQYDKSDSRGSKVTLPGLPVLIETAKDMAGAVSITPNSVFPLTERSGQVLDAYSPLIDAPVPAKLVGALASKADYAGCRAFADGTMGDYAKEVLTKIGAGNYDGFKDEANYPAKWGTESNFHKCMRVWFTSAAIGVTGAPLKGWPFGGFGTELQADYARSLIATSTFANRASEAVLEDVRSAVTPRQARAQIRDAIVEFALSDQFPEAINDSIEDANKDILFHFSGNEKLAVEFSTDNGTYGGDEAGLKIIKYGVPWFGDSRVAGADWQISIGRDTSLGSTRNIQTGD